MWDTSWVDCASRDFSLYVRSHSPVHCEHEEGGG